MSSSSKINQFSGGDGKGCQNNFFSLKQREELSLHIFSVKKYMPFSARGMLFLNTGARATEFLSKLQ